MIPDRIELAPALVTAIGALRRSLRRSTAAPWLGGALTGAQLELLRLLRREPGVSVAQAAERLRLAPNTVSTLVGGLVRGDLVVRERDARDGRMARLRLSGGALETITAWRDERSAVLAGALARLDAADRDAIAAAIGPLTRLVTAIDDAAATPPSRQEAAR